MKCDRCGGEIDGAAYSSHYAFCKGAKVAEADRKDRASEYPSDKALAGILQGDEFGANEAEAANIDIVPFRDGRGGAKIRGYPSWRQSGNSREL